MSEVHLRYFQDLSLKWRWYVWDMSKISLRNVFDMSEIHLTYVWDTFEICQWYGWDRPEIWQRYVWDMSEYAWDMPEIRLRYNWDITTGRIGIFVEFHLCDSVTEWLSDEPGAWDACASKKFVLKVSTKLLKNGLMGKKVTGGINLWSLEIWIQLFLRKLSQDLPYKFGRRKSFSYRLNHGEFGQDSATKTSFASL